MASHFQSSSSIVSGCRVACQLCGCTSCDNNCAAFRKVCNFCHKGFAECACAKCTKCSSCVYWADGCKCNLAEIHARNHKGCSTCTGCKECNSCKCVVVELRKCTRVDMHPRCFHCGKCEMCGECDFRHCTECTSLALCPRHACSDSTCSHQRCGQCSRYCCNDKSQCKCMMCMNVECTCKHK